MTENAYEQLANALDRLPNGFAKTQSGVEIVLLKRLVSEEEASIASKLGRTYEAYDKIADRLGLPEEEARSKLKAMAERGIIRSQERDGKAWYRLAPFVVGIYEARALDVMDHDFAHLFDQWLAEGGAAGFMAPLPAIHRVLPAHGTVRTEWILPYDDVKALLQAQKSFNVRNCVCRIQQDHVGRKCTFPLDICINFSTAERQPREGDISKEEALALLDKAEDLGLVHTVSNVMKGLGYVCNCCGCCCGIMRGVNEYGLEGALAHSSYYSEVDKDTCSGCGLCVQRCQVKAVSLDGETATVDRGRCIGCGLCATKCPTGAARLFRKPEAEIVVPPADTAAWEEERLHNRGFQA
jgi:electron transport complex protein RnfB